MIDPCGPPTQRAPRHRRSLSPPGATFERQISPWHLLKTAHVPDRTGCRKCSVIEMEKVQDDFRVNGASKCCSTHGF
eukprot:7609877-Pyramimonas_sp.AAC.1